MSPAGRLRSTTQSGRWTVGSVGDARDFLSAHCKLERWKVAHYITVVEDPAGDLAAISTCCDGTRDGARMLAGALTAITSQVMLAPDSDGIIVSREDLRAVLTVLAESIPAGIRGRFREALGEADRD